MTDPGKSSSTLDTAHALLTGAPGPFVAQAGAEPERRRPGRLSKVDPALIPLLRDSAVTDSVGATADADPDDLGSIKGITISLLLAGIFWMLFAWWIW